MLVALFTKFAWRTGMIPVRFLFSGLGAALLCVPVPARAQFLVRTWLPWRTVETRDFAFHYPTDLAAWTLEVARHADAIDSAVTRITGYTPTRRTDVVVDDPYETPNGSAWPYIDQPLVELWATPPSPRDDIGDFRVWGDVLLSHEFGHIAHLARPSRDPFTRWIWRALAVDLGPIALETPRWAFEGYATYIEGRVTGSGRPHGAWRAAFLRQWALEGQLPRYDQLDGSSGYEGGEFAYFAGSAFLEWLAAAHGDSSLVMVWRRLTARQSRSFDDAFAGVFGESPATLYGRFTADLTEKAFSAARARGPLATADTGEIIQRLARSTGDPAISPDGARAAIVLRSGATPSRVVIWSTTSEPDTARARRDAMLIARDPEDVPARPIFPPPKRVLETLVAPAGAPYEGPRFTREGRVVLWRDTEQGDGTIRPDVYVWDTTTSRVRRVTTGASVRDPDPLRSGTAAIAAQCRHGWCDVVRVDLRTGAVRTLLAGSPTITYDRPRVSPDGRRFAVAVNAGASWAIVVADTAGAHVVRVAADSTANWYDADWRSDTTLVAVSDRRGIADLYSMNLSSGHVRQLTRVTGAAVAPAYDARHDDVWFLSLYSRGYDLRRTPASAGRDASAPRLSADLAPAVPTPAFTPPALPTNAVTPPRSFGLTPRFFRWIPVPSTDADGISGGLGLVSMDVIGRSEVLLNAATGSAATWRGAAVDGEWRGTRPAIHVELFDAAQAPGNNHGNTPDAPTLAARIAGGLVAVDGALQFDAWQAHARAGASLARSRDVAFWDTNIQSLTTRSTFFGDGGISWQHQAASGAILGASANASAEGARDFDASVVHVVGTASIGERGLVPIPLSASASLGRTSRGAPPFEQFAIGGDATSLLDPSLLSQRITMPALPTGTNVGSAIAVYRIAVPTPMLSPYFWGGRTTGGRGAAGWNRVAGAEWTTSVPAFAATGTPGAQARIGVGESLDPPLQHRVRVYAALVLRP